MEIAAVLTKMAANKRPFKRAEIEGCRQEADSGARLKTLYRQRTGKKLDKLKMSILLTAQMFSSASRHRIHNRPIIGTLEKVVALAARNRFPTMREVWEKNQQSKYFGMGRR
jgi:hypothetical protein